MRIAHLLPRFEEGGVERVVLELNREMAAVGHKPFVFSLGGRLEEQAKADGSYVLKVNLASKNPLTFPSRARTLMATLANVQPDIVHVHSRVPAWLLRLGGAKRCYPVVSTVHGFNHVSLYSKVMTDALKVTVPSSALKRHVIKYYRIPESQVAVVPWGIDPGTFSDSKVDPKTVEQIRKICDNNSKCHLIASIGRLSGRKGHDLFIKALAMAQRKRGNLFGVVIGGKGDSSERDRLIRLSHSEGMGDRIRMVDTLDDIVSAYSAIDILVVASPKPEGFGRVALEAIAMNRPVVAARQGGILDIVKDGVNGILYEPGEIGGMAAAIIRAANAEWGSLRPSVEAFQIGRSIDEINSIYRNCREMFLHGR